MPLQPVSTKFLLNLKELTIVVMRAFSIKTRLFVYSMLFSFAGLLLVGGYSYHIASKSLLYRTFSQLTSIREEKKNQVEHFFTERIRETELIASTDDICAIAKITTNSNTFNSNIFKDTPTLNSIVNFISRSNYYSSIY